jgi:ribonuclease D
MKKLTPKQLAQLERMAKWRERMAREHPPKFQTFQRRTRRPEDSLISEE